MATKISYSSELISNYMQAETIAPDKQFQALQSNDGHSLLFSIGTDGIFYLTEEVNSLSTGWQKSDLSSVISSDFPGSSIMAKTFFCGQNNVNNKFTVALAVTVSGNDYLYVASAYTRDENGLIVLTWDQMPFDAPGKSYSSLNISDIYILQTASVPLIVVSIVPPGSTTIERYYIDSTKYVSDTFWNLYTLPVNMNAQSASVCGGRKYGDRVDGMYSLGTVGTVANVYYQPIYLPGGDGIPAAASQLTFGTTAAPAAIASTPSAASQSSSVTYTDLYVTTADGGLYFFAATNQANNAVGLNIMTNDLFTNIVSLYAYTANGKTVVWGLNRNEQIFYTQCSTSQVTDPSAWSYPLPIGANVIQISPYINRVNGGNTFFAHTGANQLQKVFQDPVSTTWTTQQILLPVDPQTKAQPFDCYMTRFTITDEENTPLTDVPVKIASAYRVPVYINNHYFVLDTGPISITTDSQGAIKIVQPVINLQGACLNIQSTDGSASLSVNPMDNAAAQVATLNTADALSAAQVTADNGSSDGPLVSPDTSEDDLNSAAASIQSLSDAYNTYNQPMAQTNNATTSAKYAYSPSAKVYTLSVSSSAMQLNVVSDVGETLSSIGDAIVVAAGDLCSWLKDAADYVIQIIEDTAQKIWNFVATVAGKVYTFVIDTIEKVIDALQAIFNALKTLITKLVQFLKFLFDWDDITRTKDVFTNMIHLYLDYGVLQIEKLKIPINKELISLQQQINAWAGLPPVADPTYADQALNYQQSQTDYTGVYTTPNTYLQDHFTNNIANASYTGDNGNSGTALKQTIIDLINTFVDALESEKDVLTDALDQLQTQLFEGDKYKTMSLTDILTVCTGIIADALLQTAGVIIDAFIDLVVQILDGLIAMLTQPIWIPVVSDILENIFGYEFQFSLLDVLCLVGAIPATLIYKLMTNNAPFSPDDGYSTQIIEAVDYQSLEAAFGKGGPVDYSQQYYSSFWLPETAKETIFIVAHSISGTASLVNSVLILAEDLAQLPYVPYISGAKTLCSLIQSASYSAAGVFAKPYPIQDEAVSELSSAITYLSMASSVIFFVAPKLTKSEVTKSTIAYVGAGVDIVLSLTAIAPVAYHFVELAGDDSNNFRTLAIIDETARITGYLSSIVSDVAKFDVEPTTSTVIAVVGSGLALLNGSLQISESIVAE